MSLLYILKQDELPANNILNKQIYSTQFLE